MLFVIHRVSWLSPQVLSVTLKVLVTLGTGGIWRGMKGHHVGVVHLSHGGPSDGSELNTSLLIRKALFTKPPDVEIQQIC